MRRGRGHYNTPDEAFVTHPWARRGCAWPIPAGDMGRRPWAVVFIWAPGAHKLHGTRIMVLGLSLSAYTIIHVIISLIAIAAGFIAVFEMIAGKPLGLWNQIFLWTTIATSVTGFGFPFGGITPGIVVGVISLAILAVALFALYGRHLAGTWRWIYVVSAIAALWFNVFVGIVQSFQKIGILNALAPTQSEPPFQIAQGAGLVLIVVLAIFAVRKFRPMAA
jgi:hypothetical protein